jgi:sugar/nucleoside kinase (ribokinase family)
MENGLERVLLKILGRSRTNVPAYDVLCIGSSIIFHYICASDEWLRSISIELGIEKGSVITITKNQFESIIASHMRAGGDEPLIASGGSAVTVAKGLAHQEVNVGLMSCSGTDTYSHYFENSLDEDRVAMHLNKYEGNTALVLCIVTPDGERTFLFAGDEKCGTPRVDDIDPELIQSAKVLHLEGFTLRNKQMLDKALRVAKKAGVKISFDLGSYVIVRENREFIQRKILPTVDYLFGNADEMCALFGDDDKIDRALKIRPGVTFALHGDKGGIFYDQGVRSTFAANRAQVVDSSGAGDLFASGVLAGIANHLELEESVALGSFIASRVVSRLGSDLPQSEWEEISEEFSFSYN